MYRTIYGERRRIWLLISLAFGPNGLPGIGVERGFAISRVAPVLVRPFHSQHRKWLRVGNRFNVHLEVSAGEHDQETLRHGIAHHAHVVVAREIRAESQLADVNAPQ